MTRNLILGAATASLLAAPVAAQDASVASPAPSRATAPTDQGNEMASSWILALLAVVAVVAAIIIATKDHNDPVSP